MAQSLECHNGNNIRLFGLTNAERVERMQAKFGGKSDAAGRDSVLCVDLDYAFDPIWFRHIAEKPGRALCDGDNVVLMHRNGGDSEIVESWDRQENPALYNQALRKTQYPFCMPLTAGNRRKIERESYYGAYKGVTDILTKYLWPEIALHLTRLAATLRMSPNMVTAIGAILCVLAAYLFAGGQYWWGVAAGFVFMVLDTVDGKLARCTMTSSWWGNIFDHGIDLVHPPFWYWFWATGLVAWGLAYDPTTFWWVQGIIWAGYIIQRLIEGVFMRKYGFHIHVWRKFDSDFRLITARRNPNMVLLVGSLLFARPDIGLILVAAWTVLSLIVHAVQLLQAMASRGEVRSWLEEKAE